MRRNIMIWILLLFSVYSYSQKQFTQGVITPTVTGSNMNDSNAAQGIKIQSMYNDTASWRNKIIIIKVLPDTQTVKITDSLLIVIPSEFNNYNITGVQASVFTASSVGLPTFQIGRGIRATPSSLPTYNAVLSTLCTIDATEYSSTTAATPAVVNPSYKNILTGYILKLYCTVAGTGTKGLQMKITLRK